MEKKHHARTLPHTGHVKNSDEGSPDFVVGQSFLECVVFLSSRHRFYFFPDMDRKNLCCACSAWSGFSVARTFFRPRFITHRPDLCQIGGMSSPDKKDSFRVIYFKNRALKDSKNVSIRHHLPFYKNIRDRKNLNYHFLFLKKMAAKIRRSYQKLTNAGSFSALLSQARGGLDTTCLSFFVIANFCFYKKKYCSYKNSSMIFTLHRHFSGGERVFF